MEPDRWENVEELYHRALGIDPAARAAFLREACGDDADLYREVDSLLSLESKTEGFIESATLEVAAQLVSGGSDPLIGNQIGNYKIIRLLGRGGMGKVYLAEDVSLGRKLALKFLPSHFLNDGVRLRRFELEARAASALNHPNILTIHEIGEEEGHHFIATEFIEGQTLRDRLRLGLEIDEALDIAIQVASALVAAHRVNIMHRDIKPENIMIRKDDGLVKVLDFGLAKVIQRRQHRAVDSEIVTALTGPGVVMGTVAYMSPEQMRGDTVDERTDIWSLGVVLYEMVAGRSPFVGGTNNEIISAILSKELPQPLARYTRLVPERLEEIVEKALTKNRDERYQNSKDLLIDLKRLNRSRETKAAIERSTSPEKFGAATSVVQSSDPKSLPPEVETPNTQPSSNAEYIFNPVKSHKRGAMVILAVLLLAIATGVVIYVWRLSQTVPPTQPEIRSLAVLPLYNLSGDSAQEYFADGITEALISNLAQIRALRVISRTSAMRYKGTNKLLPEIAHELNVDGVIEGSVQRSGGRVHITARLIPAAADSPVWSREYDRDLSDLLKLQSEVAGAVADEIRIQVNANERARLASARSVNPQAHEAYLIGRYHLSKKNDEDLRQAIENFERAIQLAPDYAAPYSGLAEAWQERGVWGEKTFSEVEAPARAAALKAIKWDEQLAEGHMVLAHLKYIYDWDWTGAEQEFKRALELDPGSLYVHRPYAVFLMAVGRHSEAISEVERAAQLDPLSSEIQSNFGRILYRARKYEEAIPHFKRALELEPRNYTAHVRLGDVYAKLGKYDDAITMFEKAAQLRSDGMHTVRIARVYALMGGQRKARQMVSGVKAGAFEIAGVYVALGDLDEAFRILEKAVEARNSLLVFFKEDPTFDNLHSDPRWPELLRRMNFPSE
jgi:serine/threonine protein kinase/Tfp pilus assembly protein PilF